MWNEQPGRQVGRCGMRGNLLLNPWCIAVDKEAAVLDDTRVQSNLDDFGQDWEGWEEPCQDACWTLRNEDTGGLPAYLLAYAQH